MPRDINGNYSLPAGNPVTPGTTISTTWANSTLTDLATAMTDSLSRTGDGGMLVAFQLSNGTIGAPALTWTSETTSGWYRAAAGNFRFSVAAADILMLSASTGVSGALGTFTTLNATTLTGGGAGITSLNASNLASGTVADARLSSNVALKNAANTFTAAQTITSSGTPLTINTATGPGIVAASTSGVSASIGVASNGNTFGTTSFDIVQDGSNVAYLYQRSNAALLIGTNNTTRVTVAAGGNVSVAAPASGTSLTVTNAAGAVNTTMTDGTVSAFFQPFSAGSVFAFGTGSNHSVDFYTNSTAKMSLSAAGGLGVGTTGSSTAGEIRATNNITAYYSDDRLKAREGRITDALGKVWSLNGFYFRANAAAQKLGYTAELQVGVSAQEVQKVLPEIIKPAPIDPQYMTLDYAKIVPLLVEAIKELDTKVERMQ